MRLGFNIGSKSTGKYRILVQKRGESMALSMGRRHSTMERAKLEAQHIVEKYEPNYVEIVDGKKVHVFHVACT
jgi:tRNA A58 N-methylase Trm61